MTSGTKNNSMTSFYLFQDHDVILPMTPYPDDVTILFFDYDVIIFDDVNPLGYCDVTVSLCPWRRTPTSILLRLKGTLSRYICLNVL